MACRPDHVPLSGTPARSTRPDCASAPRSTSPELAEVCTDLADFVRVLALATSWCSAAPSSAPCSPAAPKQRFSSERPTPTPRARPRAAPWPPAGPHGTRSMPRPCGGGRQTLLSAPAASASTNALDDDGAAAGPGRHPGFGDPRPPSHGGSVRRGRPAPGGGTCGPRGAVRRQRPPLFPRTRGGPRPATQPPATPRAPAGRRGGGLPLSAEPFPRRDRRRLVRRHPTLPSEDKPEEWERVWISARRTALW